MSKKGKKRVEPGDIRIMYGLHFKDDGSLDHAASKGRPVAINAIKQGKAYFSTIQHQDDRIGSFDVNEAGLTKPSSVNMRNIYAVNLEKCRNCRLIGHFCDQTLCCYFGCLNDYQNAAREFMVDGVPAEGLSYPDSEFPVIEGQIVNIRQKLLSKPNIVDCMI